MLQDGGEAGVERGRPLRQFGRDGARVLAARAGRAARRVAAPREPALGFAKGAGVPGEQRRELRVALRRRHQRGGVLGDPLRQERKLIRVLDIARARAALPGTLGQFDQLLAALGDRRGALREVDQPLLAFEQLLDARCRRDPTAT